MKHTLLLSSPGCRKMMHSLALIAFALLLLPAKQARAQYINTYYSDYYAYSYGDGPQQCHVQTGSFLYEHFGIGTGDVVHYYVSGAFEFSLDGFTWYTSLDVSPSAGYYMQYIYYRYKTPATGYHDDVILVRRNTDYPNRFHYNYDQPAAITAGNNGPTCVTGNVQLTTNALSGVSCAWSGPAGYSSSTVSPTITGVTSAMAGAYTLTISASYGCTATASTTVSVNPTPGVSITGTASMCKTTTTSLSSGGLLGTWSSSSTSIAPVSSSGVVTGNNAGTANISFASSTGCGTGVVTITVNPTPAAITGAPYIPVGSSTSLSNMVAGGIWTSDNPGVATVSSAGVMTAVSPGVAYITYAMPVGGCYSVTTSEVPQTNTITPDTLFPGVAGTLTTPISARAYAWDFTALSVDQPITTSSPFYTTGGTPAFSSFCNDGGNYYVFYTQYYTHQLIRLSYGTSMSSTPVSTNLGTLGTLWGYMEGLDIMKDPATGQWYGVVADERNLVVLSFGTSLSNTPTVITHAFPIPEVMWYPHQLTLKKYGNNWIAFAADREKSILRIDFGNSLSNTPTTTNIPNMSGASTPCNFTLHQQNGQWYMLVTDLENGKLVRYNFGYNLMNNTPTGTLISGGTSLLSLPRPINLFSDCSGNLIGYLVNESGNVLKLDFHGDITTTPTYTNLGASGTNHVASSAPMIVNDTFYFLLVNFGGNIVKYRPFNMSSQGHINHYNPSQPHTFATPGTYNISLLTDPGHPSGGAAYCQPVVVLEQYAPINGATQVCVGYTATLYNDSTGGTWSSSNTSLATVDASGVVTGVSAGIVNITYTFISGPIVVATLTVVDAPTVGANIGVGAVCVGATTGLSNVTSGGYWSSGDISIATVGSATGIVTGVAEGNTVISYTVSNACGSATATTNVTVNPAPVAGSIAGPAAVTVGGTITLSSSGTTGGGWSTSNSNAMISPGGVLTGLAAGTTTVTYSVSNSCGTATATYLVTVYASVPGTLAVCLGETATLTPALSGGVWSSGNPTIASVSSTGVVTGNSAGTTALTYTASSVTLTYDVTVNPQPAAITGATAICQFASLTLADATPSGAWSCGSGASITSGGVLTPTAAGTVTVTYTLPTGCYRTATVSVNAAPSAISGTLGGVCVGNTTTFSNAISGGVWSSPATSIISIGSSSGIAIGLAAGTASVSYTLPGSCRATTIVTVNTLPGTITGAPTACPGTSTTLSCSPAGGTWASSYTSIAIADAATGVISGVASGTSTISYTTGAGCTRTTLVTINATPSAITGITGVCVGSITILSNSTPGGLSWSSSNTAVATIGATSGIATGISAGTATITYTLGTGCIVTTVLTVNSLTAITGTLKTCSGQSTTLSNSATGGTWTSSNTLVGTVASSTGVVTGIAAGTTTITYTVGTGCYKTAVVTVNASPAAISGTATACSGTTTTLSDAGGGTWASSNTAVATITSAGVVTGVTTGTAGITYTLSTGCQATTVVTISNVPGSNSGTPNVCVGATTVLSNSLSGGTWSSSNTSYATVNTSGVVTGVGAGSATITYSFGGTCRTTTVVTVKPLPGATTGVLTVCVGAATTLTNSSGTGTWSSSLTAVGTIGSISAVAGRFVGIAAGVTIVSYTFPTGCARTVVVTVNPSPSAGVITSSGGFVINTSTPPTSISLSSTGTAGGTWTSSAPSIATVNSSSGLVSAVSGGNTNITYTVTSGSCTATATHTVSVVVARPAQSTTTGMQTFTIYPNPTKGSLQVGVSQPGTFALYTVDGKEAATYTLAEGANSLELPSGLAAGMYLCRFAGADGSVSVARIVYEQ